MAGDAHESWKKEMESAWLYQVLAEVEPAPERRALFAQLQLEARKQATEWAEKLQGHHRPSQDGFVPSARARMVARLVRRLGVVRMRRILAAMKVRGMSVYDQHAVGHAMPTNVEEVGKRHQSLGGGGTLRAAVFGVNDGLVSNASLILGVAGANPQGGFIVLSGVAGLLAGAFSMAAGEYVSVRAQRELFEHQIAAEREELSTYPEEEAQELALIYQARGLEAPEAQRLAKALISDPRHALETLAREELGLNPADLGSPFRAALSSFLSFAVGAVIPLIPFLLLPARSALWTSIGLGSLCLFGVGAATSLFTGRGAWRGGARMLLLGAIAGSVTFVIGRALGVRAGD